MNCVIDDNSNYYSKAKSRGIGLDIYEHQVYFDCIQDSHWEKELTIKTPALMKSRNMNI